MSNDTLEVQGGQVRPALKFQNILVATDFSAGARRALECARKIASKFESRIFLLHVIPSDIFELASPEKSREALAKAREFAQQQFHRLMNEAGTLGIVHECIVTEGSVWPVISETVNSRRIDLLAVGTHGKTHSKKLVLGPVAEEIYRMADCPILTVPPHIEISEGREIEFNRLLFAANFKPHNERAASIAHQFECRNAMKLTMLHVVEDSAESSLPSQKLIEEFIVNRMQKALPKCCLSNCQAEFEVRFGKPVVEILASARQRHSDLILLGLRATQRTPGHLPSAIAYGIVCQATCPVLTLYQ